MPIKSLSITNLAAFKSLELSDLNGVVAITGDNETGKSSLLNCLTYIGERGHDPDILHAGAESGEIVVEFTDGHGLRARVTPKETTRSWKAPGATKWKPGRELVDKICRATQYNPVAFLDLEESKQVEEFLRLCPMPVPAEELQAAIAEVEEEAAAGVTFQPGANALEVINITRQALYNARRVVNVAADELEKFVATSEGMLPEAPDGQDWSVVVAGIAEQIQKFDADEAETLRKIDQHLHQRIQDAEQSCGNATEALRNIYAEKIRALEAERDGKIEAERKHRDDAIADLNKRAAGKVNEIRTKNVGNRNTLVTAHTEAEMHAKNQQRADAQREQITRTKAEIAEKRHKWAALNKSIENLDALKAELAKKLPIPGVRAEGGRIVNDAGVPLAKWNTATKLTFCLRLAMLVNAEAGFTVVDDAEHFGKKKFEGLIKSAQKYAGTGKMQFWIARVDEGPLTVNGVEVQ